MKKKTEPTTKQEKTENQIDYSGILPLLCAALSVPSDTVVAYTIAPMKGHGLVYALAVSEGGPFVGIFDIKVNEKGALLPGAFGIARAEGIETYSEILGYFERFAAADVSRDEIVQLFEQE